VEKFAITILSECLTLEHKITAEIIETLDNSREITKIKLIPFLNHSNYLIWISSKSKSSCKEFLIIVLNNIITLTGLLILLCFFILLVNRDREKKTRRAFTTHSDKNNKSSLINSKY